MRLDAIGHAPQLAVPACRSRAGRDIVLLVLQHVVERQEQSGLCVGHHPAMLRLDQVGGEPERSAVWMLRRQAVGHGDLELDARCRDWPPRISWQARGAGLAPVRRPPDDFAGLCDRALNVIAATAAAVHNNDFILPVILIPPIVRFISSLGSGLPCDGAGRRSLGRRIVADGSHRCAALNGGRVSHVSGDLGCPKSSGAIRAVLVQPIAGKRKSESDPHCPSGQDQTPWRWPWVEISGGDKTTTRQPLHGRCPMPADEPRSRPSRRLLPRTRAG